MSPGTEVEKGLQRSMKRKRSCSGMFSRDVNGDIEMILANGN